ncbi:MAG: type II 3-dehydroquinate dehydratase [Omnitrophica WOR_2 bacterium]|jgi:3-dehydroquinate dehydratase-2
MEKKSIVIINGPNLNLTGVREKHIYGDQSFDTLLKQLSKEFPDVEIDYYQSNIEGELINKIQNTGFLADGIILNAGGYSHTSVAIADAVKAINSPVIEVHMSNIWAREVYRHTSYISPFAKGVIAGFGLESYKLALISLLDR